MSEVAELPRILEKNKRPIVKAMIVMNCLGGIMAAVVPIGFLFWLHEQNEAEIAAQKTMARKAAAVMTIEQLPPQFRFERPQFAISRSAQGAVLIENTADGTSFYFEKKPLAKLESVRKRMSDRRTARDEFTVKARGELAVAGKTLEYVRGISRRDTGAMFNELRGFVITSDDSLVELATGTPDARDIDMEATKKLLASVKSFAP